MFVTPDIVVTSKDLQQLLSLITRVSGDAAERLDEELARAQIVAPNDVSRDVVTMNSEVIFEDTVTGAKRSVRLVYPEAADSARGWVSVLSPLGSALLGLRVQQEFDWILPHGKRRVRVVSVPYQPEANGDFTS
jgi:regulator of nucleoside diphosphate kinase